MLAPASQRPYAWPVGYALNLPTDYANLLAWWALPPKIADRDAGCICDTGGRSFAGWGHIGTQGSKGVDPGAIFRRYGVRRDAGRCRESPAVSRLAVGELEHGSAKRVQPGHNLRNTSRYPVGASLCAIWRRRGNSAA